MKDKKKLSGVTMIIILGIMLFTSYFIGIHDGRNQGKEMLCEEMGGFLGRNTKTEEISCYEGSFEDLPVISEPEYDVGDLSWE